MAKINEDAVNGILRPQFGSMSTYPIQLSNGLAVPVMLYMLEPDGEHSGCDATGQLSAAQPGLELAPGIVVSLADWHLGEVALLLTKDSGSFVTTYPMPTVAPTGPYLQVTTIDSSMLVAPNQMGSPPAPTPRSGS